MKEKPNRAFKVYQASAGSGKTYTIVREYLMLCLGSKAATSQFNQILAITFTNKAANEMKEKIKNQLLDIIDSNPEEEATGMEAQLIKDLGIERAQLKDNAKELLTIIIHNYSDFCVCTIDAFVQRLAHSFARELELPSQFNVSIDEEEVAEAITERIGAQIGPGDEHLTKVIEDFSERKFDNERSPRIANDIRDFVKVLFSENAFQKGEKNWFGNEEQYNETHDYLQRKTHDFEARSDQFIKQFGDFQRRNNLGASDFSGKSRSPCLSFYKKIQKKEYSPIADSLKKIIEGEAQWYHNDMANQRGTAAIESLNEDFKDVFLNFAQYYQGHFGEYLFYKSQLGKLSLYALRAKIKSELEAYSGEEQIVHISEFNKRLNEVMGDFSVPFVYERLGEHFKHLFIDEFQDTSVLQWQNLLPLLDNSLANSQMSMVVGDGKQSIYRWRNGEVGQIASLPLIYEKPEGSAPFQAFEQSLVNNFNFNELKTNFRSLVNVVDFNNAFFQFGSGFLSESCRKVYLEQNEQFQKEVTIEQGHYYQDPGYVKVELFDPADDDEVMLGRVKELIEDALDKGFAKSDITILVRTNKIGSLIAGYLNKHGINVVSADSIMLKTSNKVMLVVSTLDCLIHRENPAVVATMLYYWNVTHRQNFNGVVDGFFEKVRQIADGKVSLEEVLGLEPHVFKTLLSRSYSLYDLCSAIIRLSGFNMVGDIFLNFLLDTVYKWQSANEASIKGFLEYWNNKKDKLTVVSGNADAVNIMTIHKSKGLEFNVVIYPFMDDNIDNKKSTTLWITPQELGFKPIPNIQKVQFSITTGSATWTKQTQRLYELECEKARLDNLNLAYVAFTRAVQRLHVLSYQAKDLTKNPLNAFLQDHPSQYGDPETRKVELKKKKESDVKEFLYESAASEWFDKISIDPNPSMFWIHPEDKMSPVEWGTFVHQTLSEVQHEGDFDHAMKPHLDAGVIDQATAEMLRNQFQQMVHHPLISRAFSTEAKVKNECDILLADGNIVRPDRYAELPDKIYLLDYKTGKHDNEHQRQLNRYKNVLKKMVSKPIEAYLVYLGDTVEVVPVAKTDYQMTINF
ncbi:MAG: UvrD-helicase domain-containing protein [Bacteroidales bacterium]|nr:UvrD-helicase domain-containing protein [Bacteroidales bacterium]